MNEGGGAVVKLRVCRAGLGINFESDFVRCAENFQTSHLVNLILGKFHWRGANFVSFRARGRRG